MIIPNLAALGSSCLPRILMHEHIVNVRSFEKDRFPIGPFDYTLTPYNVLLDVLATNCGCLDRSAMYIDEQQGTETMVVKVHGYDGWIWPNELDLVKKYYPNYLEALFDAAYARMLKNFTKLIQRVSSARYFTFLLEAEEFPCELEKVLENKFPSLEFQILMLHRSDLEFPQKSRVVSVKHTYPGNADFYPWWDGQLIAKSKGQQWKNDLGFRLKESTDLFERAFQRQE